MKTYEEIKVVVQVCQELDIYGNWAVDVSGDVQCLINCNDVFFWGCADAEPLNPDDLHVLRKAHDDLDAFKNEQGVTKGFAAYADTLYCSINYP